MNLVDQLLEKPCYIIDFLPQKVNENCNGQFFEVENYLLNHYDRFGIRDRIICILLKMMCYYPVSVLWSEWIENPKPEQVVYIIDTIMKKQSGELNVIFTNKNALLQFDWDCLNISIYNPNGEMKILFEKIASSEGMFWRKAE